MKNGILLLLIILLNALPSRAQKYKMGLGLRLSSSEAIVNHSISFKYFFSESLAGEALLSFGNPSFGLLVQKHQRLLGKRFQFFYGGGGYVEIKEAPIAGIQAVLGLDYKLPFIPINLSFDWKPEANITGDKGFQPAVIGLTARFTFKGRR